MALSIHKWALLVALVPFGGLAAAGPLQDVRFTPRIGVRLPEQAVWTDAFGKPATLAAWQGGQPAILTVVDFDCPHLCGPYLADLAHTLRAVRWQPGRDYRILVAGLDPSDGAPAVAAVTHQWRQVAGNLDGLAVVRAPAATVSALLSTLGIVAVYDPQQHAYAHPAVATVLTPDGRIATYLPGFNAAPRAVRLALFTASSGRLGGPFDQIVLRCYHLDPLTGRYSLAGWRMAQAASLLVLAAMVGLVWRLSRRR